MELRGSGVNGGQGNTLADALEEGIRVLLSAGEGNLGYLEMQIERDSRELQRLAAEKGAQRPDYAPAIIFKQAFNPLLPGYLEQFDSCPVRPWFDGQENRAAQPPVGGRGQCE